MKFSKKQNGLLINNEHEFNMSESLHTARECMIEDRARAYIKEVNPKLYRRLYGTLIGAVV